MINNIGKVKINYNDKKKLNAHYVDRHVGQRLKKRRLMCKMSQQDLANCVGLTFQQIQKYEKGDNRISCSKLYDFAKVLHLRDLGYFFEGLDEITPPVENKIQEQQYQNYNEVSNTQQHSLHEPEQYGADVKKLEALDVREQTEQLITCFSGIKIPKIRKNILTLVELISHKHINDNKTNT